MDLRKLAEEAIALAKTASSVLPSIGTGADIADGILDIIDHLKGNVSVPADTAKELDDAHRELYEAMMAKGHDLSTRLRG